MRLCDRYLLKEFLQAFLIGLVASVLLVVALKFQQATTQLARDKSSIGVLFQQILWDLPNVLEMSLPVATALGAALATNRLARDHELTVLRGTGTSLLRLFLPFTVLGAFLAGAGLYTANELQPRASQRRKQLAGLPVSGTFEPFQTVRGGSRGEWLIQFQQGNRTSETSWQLVQVALIQKERVLVAKSAHYSSNTGHWTLQDVVEHRYDASGRRLGQTRRPTWPEPIPARTDFSPPVAFWELQQSFQTPLSFTRLHESAINARKNGNLKLALEYETARWFKLALSCMCFVFAVCAPPLSFKFSKAGSLAGVLLSVVIVFVGWNTVLFMKSVALSGWVPPLVCAFLTHGVFLIVGLVLLKSSD